MWCVSALCGGEAKSKFRSNTKIIFDAGYTSSKLCGTAALLLALQEGYRSIINITKENVKKDSGDEG